jgi:hypothetical protein
LGDEDSHCEAPSLIPAIDFDGETLPRASQQIAAELDRRSGGFYDRSRAEKFYALLSPQSGFSIFYLNKSVKFIFIFSQLTFFQRHNGARCLNSEIVHGKYRSREFDCFVFFFPPKRRTHLAALRRKDSHQVPHSAIS